MIQPSVKASSADMAVGSISADKQAMIQVKLSQVLEEDAGLREYREQMREYLIDRRLEPFEKLLLNELRDELGLSIEQTDQVLAEEQAPILRAQSAYQQRLSALVKGGHYPFNASIRAELKRFQVKRGLTNAEDDAVSFW